MPWEAIIASNVQKTPLARTLNQFTERKVRGIMALTGQSLPASVVAVVSSGIVTIKFELQNIPYTLPNLTCPLFGPEYIRYPIQKGCKGFVVPADAYLGGVSGLGGGTADLKQRGNLSSLVFFPIGNKGWSTTDDPNAVVIYGPDGAIIRDTGKKNILTWSDTGVTMAITAGTLVITVPTGQNVTINGGAVINVPGSEAATVNGNLAVNGNLLLSGTIEGAGSGTYARNIATSGDITARAGTAGSVGVATHTHEQGVDSHGDTEQPVAPPTGGT